MQFRPKPSLHSQRCFRFFRGGLGILASILGAVCVPLHGSDLLLNPGSSSSNVHDFNGDLRSDLIFSDAQGNLAAWFMNGAILQGAAFFHPSRVNDPRWRFCAAADLNHDHDTDLLFQHADGTLLAWIMDGLNSYAFRYLNPSSPDDPNWRVQTAADFNQDGRPDLLFQHADGTLAVWHMDFISSISGSLLAPSHPGSKEWRVIGAGRFNTDAHPDLLFQHEDGQLAVWLMEGLRLVQPVFLNPHHPGDKQWRVAAVTDLNRDGFSDLIFQHQANRSLAAWFMNGTTLMRAALLQPVHPGGTWSLCGP